MGGGYCRNDPVRLVGVTRCLALTSILTVVLATGCESRTPESTTRDDSQELRIVTLAPHLAEMLFDVGAGELLVGVSAYTDYPPQALSLPVIGDAFMIDQERLAVLQPDLVLAWQSGTPRHVADELINQGYQVELIQTRGLRDVALALRRIGELTRRKEQANAVAERFLEELSELGAKFSGAEPIRVFYQVDKRPIYTINGDHFVSELIDLCGGVNIFADIGNLAPLVSVEAVLERNPEVLLASEDAQPDAFSEWLRWQGLAANRYGNRFYMPAGEIGRATTRLVQAGRTLCETLEDSRGNRDGATD